MRAQIMRPVVENFTQVADVNTLTSNSLYQTRPGRYALDRHRKVAKESN